MHTLNKIVNILYSIREREIVEEQGCYSGRRGFERNANTSPNFYHNRIQWGSVVMQTSQIPYQHNYTYQILS